jgi:ketosteroid isomerase-like protein
MKGGLRWTSSRRDEVAAEVAAYDPVDLYVMPASDLDTAQQFQSAVEAAFRTGDFGPVAAFLAPDVECVTPQHSLSGPEAMIEELNRARPTGRLDVELESGDWKRRGDGRYSRAITALFRSQETGELSYSRDRSFELTIRDGKVSRYEMRFDA